MKYITNEVQYTQLPKKVWTTLRGDKEHCDKKFVYTKNQGSNPLNQLKIQAMSRKSDVKYSFVTIRQLQYILSMAESIGTKKCFRRRQYYT